MGNLVKIQANSGTGRSLSCVAQGPDDIAGDRFDAALAELLAAETVVTVPARRGVDLVRLEPVLSPGAGPDLPGIRAMVLALAGPGRPALHRVEEIADLLSGLAELGRHALVADLTELAVRSLAGNAALTRNPQDWVWDAAVDLVDLHIAACAHARRPGMRLPEALGSAPRKPLGPAWPER
jgi:hypothetical protein